MKKVRQVFQFPATTASFEATVQEIRNMLVKNGGTLVKEECVFEAIGKEREQLLLVIVYNSNPDVRVKVEEYHNNYIISDAHVHSFEPEDITGFISFYTVAGVHLDHVYSLLMKTTTSYSK